MCAVQCLCMCMCICVYVWVCDTVSFCMHDSLRSVSELLDSKPAEGKQCVCENCLIITAKRQLWGCRHSMKNINTDRQYFTSLWWCTGRKKKKKLTASSVCTYSPISMNIIKCNVFHTFILTMIIGHSSGAIPWWMHPHGAKQTTTHHNTCNKQHVRQLGYSPPVTFLKYL